MLLHDTLRSLLLLDLFNASDSEGGHGGEEGGLTWDKDRDTQARPAPTHSYPGCSTNLNARRGRGRGAAGAAAVTHVRGYFFFFFSFFLLSRKKKRTFFLKRVRADRALQVSMLG